ncbi:uncharacterized protein EV420DRAFT_1668818 [Desarmillaria tabescens]|uniref:DUF6534 domain-containing protein n=1 Tax=Armillaria tabescens TaxID=1929756 RepID=A0AA39N8V1_ARMTA|nr:uncharacterized protein EV420DRAFT_1668818 [Desarmillaria tabescens]KAK0461148.1 hypothetical protein EV420DRAFT_1668818 [Desarmillaria tabescens]
MSDLAELPYAVPHKTLGVLLVALAVSSSIYGVTCAQTVQYCRRYSRSDSTILKVAVAVVWGLETLNQGLTMFSEYYYLVRNRGSLEALSYTEWSLAILPGTNGLAASIIQFFFAYRVYIMSDRNWYFAGSVCAMSVAQFAVAFGAYFAFFNGPKGYNGPSLFSCDGTNVSGLQVVLTCLTYHPRLSLRFPAVVVYYRFDHLVPPAFAITAATDVFITVSLCYYLQIRKSGLGRTDSVVNRLILLTINNGILSSVIALTAFVCQLAASGTMLPFAMCFLLGKGMVRFPGFRNIDIHIAHVDSLHEYSPVQLELEIKHEGTLVTTNTYGNTAARSTTFFP